MLKKKEFEERHLAWADKMTARSHMLLKKNPNAKAELPPHELLAREVPEVLKTI